MRIPAEPDLARIGALIGEPARAAILAALLGGETLTAGELARRAGVVPGTASEHLARLVSGGLLTRRVNGRQRHFSLAGEHVAAALEALARVAAAPSTVVGGQRAQPNALQYARTCYDHLAGVVGVRLTDTLVERGFVSLRTQDVTTLGESWLGGLGIDVAELRGRRRPLVRACLDWSERRDHLAGSAGAALASVLLAKRWLVRMDGTRAVRLTVRGRDGLYRTLSLAIEPHA